MDPALVERVRKLYDADNFATGVPAVLAIAHPEIEVVPAAAWLDQAPSFHGPDGVQKYFAGLEQVFENMHYELLDLADLGDVLLAQVNIHIEGRESGATIARPFFQVFWFEDGLIRRVQGFTDRADALEAATS